MRTIEKLMSSENNKKIGNHRVEVERLRKTFYYYATPICTIDYITREIIIDNGGYGTQSTTRAINYYIRSLQDLVDYRGFKIVDKR